MNLPISSNLHTFSSASSSPSFYSPTFPFSSHSFQLKKFRKRLNCNPKPPRISFSSEKDECSSLNGNRSGENREGNGNLWEDSEFVEVIGIGSRKDAVLDFCLGSPFLSSSLRFWNIFINNSVKVQLQQRFLGKDITPRIVEAPSTLQSCSKAVILVASAAYGSDHITALDILKTVKSANGLVVGIILKPFRFEGRRRQDEVKDLVDKIQRHTNFCIVVDTDALLEKDFVTLDEALKTANNAILMAINVVYILISEVHLKFLDVLNNNMKELKVSEMIKILGNYKDAKIGFGTGYNIKTSIVRAIYDCPFLGDLNGVVVCVLSSSGVIDSSEPQAILHTFRQTAECERAIIISITHEPNLEPNLILTTIITVGPHETPKESSIFSRLAQHFPFIFSILRKHHPQSHKTAENYSPENPHLSEAINSADSCKMPNVIPVDSISEGIGIYSTELQTLLSNSSNETDDGINSEQSEGEFSDADSDSSTSNRNTEGYQIAQELLARDGANDSVATSMLENLSIYELPVGVRPLKELEGCLSTSNKVNASVSWAARDAVVDFYNNAAALLKGNYANVSKKQGILSVRAASMLEAERNSQKKWNPMVEIKYRGGIYRGRCQGGLPEGKGRLSLGDGSIYDGMWRYGMRSGLGTFYFRNGDVFQGSWREDVMHGKGWFYFLTGDRWFVKFWKGKANGEGRFYSKLGDVFFGHFKDGWRHGHFLHINVDGTRCLEIWDEGVLVSCKQLDSDASTV